MLVSPFIDRYISIIGKNATTTAIIRLMASLCVVSDAIGRRLVASVALRYAIRTDILE